MATQGKFNSIQFNLNIDRLKASESMRYQPSQAYLSVDPNSFQFIPRRAQLYPLGKT